MQERRRRERAKAKIPCSDPVKTPTQYWEDLEQRNVTILCKHALAEVYPSSNILLPFLGRELLVDREYRRLLCLKHGRSVPMEDDLLELLCLVYLLNVGPEPLSYQMITAHDLRDSQFFKGPHEIKVLPLLRRYGSDLDGFKEAAERLGSEIVEAADVAYRVPAFPKIPIYYLFWKGDEEFEPRLSILFDQSIEYHLSADAIWGLTNLVSEILLMGTQWSLG
jgi:hypothetical protein